MNQFPEAIDALLTALESPDPRLRDAAALHLRDFAEAAVEALFHAAGRPENRNHRGTLVHVLSEFRCEDHFSELFEMALHGNDEVQCHALSILQGQAFSLTKPQLLKASQSLEILQPREGLPEEDLGLLREELRSVLARCERDF